MPDFLARASPAPSALYSSLVLRALLFHRVAKFGFSSKFILSFLLGNPFYVLGHYTIWALIISAG